MAEPAAKRYSLPPMPREVTQHIIETPLHGLEQAAQQGSCGKSLWSTPSAVANDLGMVVKSWAPAWQPPPTAPPTTCAVHARTHSCLACCSRRAGAQAGARAGGALRADDGVPGRRAAAPHRAVQDAPQLRPRQVRWPPATGGTIASCAGLLQAAAQVHMPALQCCVVLAWPACTSSCSSKSSQQDTGAGRRLLSEAADALSGEQLGQLERDAKGYPVKLLDVARGFDFLGLLSAWEGSFSVSDFVLHADTVISCIPRFMPCVPPA